LKKGPSIAPAITNKEPLLSDEKKEALVADAMANKMSSIRKQFKTKGALVTESVKKQKAIINRCSKSKYDVIKTHNKPRTRYVTNSRSAKTNFK
jgi:archaellum component FlaG (FlaF/FlaG flagellin family)